jgi:hypothetical protein
MKIGRITPSMARKGMIRVESIPFSATRYPIRIAMTHRINSTGKTKLEDNPRVELITTGLPMAKPRDFIFMNANGINMAPRVNRISPNEYSG